jgi:arabinose-5-phosphate isomerase
MITGNKIPLANENLEMSKALKILTQKKLGILIITNKKRETKGIITDGQVRRFSQTNQNLHTTLVKNVMTKKPIGINKDALAAKALSLMNSKKITSLYVYDKKISIKLLG